ncbi:hypothetical protein GE061_010995 [Apolygus lucorum]|uniref:Uncharacterized protein n=1 Tax=Apolygus lucorum TaxID=248454 RepID=A0A8S9XWJ4_APOLU|nr:hypothetical protein GE061_010995 [Apolygus lucorum]
MCGRVVVKFDEGADQLVLQGPGESPPERFPPLGRSSASPSREEQYRELCCASDMSLGNYTSDLGGAAAPAYPAFYTRVTAGTPGGRSTLHAVLDYDDDEPSIPKGQAAPYPLPSTQYSSGGTYPYQGPRGPVVVKNDSVAVVPLYSYGPTVNSNGSFVHIPLAVIPDTPRETSRPSNMNKTFIALVYSLCLSLYLPHVEAVYASIPLQRADEDDLKKT